MDGSGFGGEYREESQPVVHLVIVKMFNSITASRLMHTIGLGQYSRDAIWHGINESGTRMLMVTEVMLSNDGWREE